MALKNILIGLADSGIDDAKKVPSMKSGEGDRHSNKENAAAAAHVGGKRDDDKDDEDDELGPIAENLYRARIAPKSVRKTSPTEVLKTPSSWTT